MTKNNEEKALIQWKNNDWAAFVAACLKLQASHAWKEATAQDYKEMEDLLKQQVMHKQYINLTINLAVNLIFI